MESRYYTNKAIRKYIDRRLRKNMSIMANLGRTCSEKDKKAAKKKIEKNIKEIKTKDPFFL